MNRQAYLDGYMSKLAADGVLDKYVWGDIAPGRKLDTDFQTVNPNKASIPKRSSKELQEHLNELKMRSTPKVYARPGMKIDTGSISKQFTLSDQKRQQLQKAQQAINSELSSRKALRNTRTSAVAAEKLLRKVRPALKGGAKGLLLGGAATATGAGLKYLVDNPYMSQYFNGDKDRADQPVPAPAKTSGKHLLRWAQ